MHERSATDRVATVLEIVAALAGELHPKGRGVRVELDSRLDQDLGFDSLSRSELILRIEAATGSTLPDGVLGTAETPRDLVRAIGDGGVTLPSAPRVDVHPIPSRTGAPVTARTLAEVLEWHAERQGERTHVEIYDGERLSTITYRELEQRSRAAAGGLRRAGIDRGAVVAIMLPTGREFLETFMGVIVAGAVPLPIYPPVRPSQLEEHLRRHARILDNAQAQLLVADERALPFARLLSDHAPSVTRVLRAVDLVLEASEPFATAPGTGDDVAFLQYTSGSTGQPKGVVLTHAQVLANIRAMATAIEATPSDVFVSWLPLYHDLGLIGAWLGSLYVGMTLVLMSPLAFLARPARWLQRIHAHRGTISAAPNFAYETCASKLRDEELAGLDLGSWRLAFNGAEPVRAETVQRFCRRFASYGFRPEAMAPAYGLAEAGVGLSIPPLGRGPVVDRVERVAFERRGEALPAPLEDDHALEFVACGRPLPGYEIRIVDDGERELPERREGHIEFRGPSATRGYLRNPEATQRLFRGTWLDSGDVGYIAAGDLFVTSRIKDLIKRAGRNIHPYELEEAIGELDGIVKGGVAVFGMPGPAAEGELLIVVAETPLTEPNELIELRRRVEARAVEVLRSRVDDVRLVPPRSVPKTASGKIRRADCRDLYTRGELEALARTRSWRMVRLWLAGHALRTQKRALSSVRRLASTAYAVRSYAAFVLFGLPAWLFVAAWPTERARWAVVRHAARRFLRLAGIAVRTEGIERLPTSPAVLVCNHSSYLDGVVLIAMLPMPVSFVVKAELARGFFARRFLERIGACFVERFDARKGVDDAHRTTELVRGGRSALYFPEGTFTRMPGLLPFHTGAFVTAIDAQVPAVPITLSGTRSLLRPESWLPRRGNLSLEIGDPIAPGGTDWSAAMRMQRDVRSAILARCGEPDLAGEHAIPREPKATSA
jgi:1-acyl-sn-glycerol-3-phosphate acyltransferase